MQSDTKSNTPRTDEQEFHQECNFDVAWEDFARQLERELNESRSEVARLKKELETVRQQKLITANEAFIKQDAQNASLKSALRELHRDCTASDFNEHWESYKIADSTLKPILEEK